MVSTTLRNGWRGVAALVDLRDLVAAVGLGLVAAGLALVSTPAALIVPGAALFYLAVWRPAPGRSDRSRG